MPRRRATRPRAGRRAPSSSRAGSPPSACFPARVVVGGAPQVLIGVGSVSRCPRLPSARSTVARRRRCTAAGRSPRVTRASSSGSLLLTPVFTTALDQNEERRSPRGSSRAGQPIPPIEKIVLAQDVLAIVRPPAGRCPTSGSPSPTVPVTPEYRRPRGLLVSQLDRASPPPFAPLPARGAARARRARPDRPLPKSGERMRALPILSRSLPGLLRSLGAYVALGGTSYEPRPVAGPVRAAPRAGDAGHGGADRGRPARRRGRDGLPARCLPRRRTRPRAAERRRARRARTKGREVTRRPRGGAAGGPPPCGRRRGASGADRRHDGHGSHASPRSTCRSGCCSRLLRGGVVSDRVTHRAE